MVNVTYTPTSSDMLYTQDDGTEVIYNLGDIAWGELEFPSLCIDATLTLVLTSMALVWLMIPGVGFFYSGLLRRKNALSMLFLSLVGISVGTIQWVVWGYS